MDIFGRHQQFLGFSWTFVDRVQYFASTGLPFGLSTVCYCFSKLLHALVKRWGGGSKSRNPFVYLDDGIFGHRDGVSACAASSVQRSDFAWTDIVSNDDKSNWQPVQVSGLLDFVIDTIHRVFLILQAKLAKLKYS